MAVDLIDFISSLRRPGGAELGERGAYQLRYTAFRPFATVKHALSPRASHYAAIGQRLSFGHDIVPDVFTVVANYSGGGTYSGVLTKTVIENGFSDFMLLTHANPLHLSATNTTGLFQYYEAVIYFFTIPTKGDLDFILAALDDLSNSGERARMDETNRLLKDIRAALKPSRVPLPPLPLPVRLP